MSAFKEKGFTLLEILIAITILAFISLAVVNVTENAALTMERTTQTNENNLQIETALGRMDWDFTQIYSPLYFSTVMNLNPNLDQNGIPIQTGGTPNQTNPYIMQYQEQLMARFERNEHFKAVSKEGVPVPRFFNPEKSILEVFTTSNRRKIENQKQSHFAWVRYSLTEQEQTPEEESNSNIPKNLKSLVRYFSADDPWDDKKYRANRAMRQVMKGSEDHEQWEDFESKIVGRI